ncbi:MAG: type II toxin-antitoxin system VapC family toxin [Ignavibacteria bacterium]|jgi:PIN domain nuclease of toxin-antitoxin system
MVIADTHIIIWDALQPGKLSKKARKEFDKADNSGGIIFCDISLWEISMLMAKKRIEIDITFTDFIDLVLKTRNYIIQSITPEIADISTNLITQKITDPADRLISATAISIKAPLITADKNIRASKEIKTIW